MDKDQNGVSNLLEMENTFFFGADERRRKLMEISDAARQRMEAEKAALKRLREHLVREGW